MVLLLDQFGEKHHLFSWREGYFCLLRPPNFYAENGS